MKTLCCQDVTEHRAEGVQPESVIAEDEQRDGCRGDDGQIKEVICHVIDK